MRRRHALIAAIGLMLAPPPAARAQTPPDADIDYLIRHVEHSGCEFVRNGSAHPSAEAAAHLRRKYQAARRTLNAEQFIEHIASKSSLSGQPYRVRCDGAPEEATGLWLRRALKERPT